MHIGANACSTYHDVLHALNQNFDYFSSWILDKKRLNKEHRIECPAWLYVTAQLNDVDVVVRESFRNELSIINAV